MKVRLNCKEMARLISDGQDTTLPLVERAKMQLHFAACRPCRNVDEQVGLLRRTVRQWEQQVPPGG